LGIPGQNDIWVLVSCLGTKYTIRGKVVISPSSGHGESCESVFAFSSFVHQKCSNYALTNLLFDLCRSMWIIDLLVTLPSPYLKLQHAPLPSKCCELRSVPQLLLLSLFSLLDSQLNPSISLGARHFILYELIISLQHMETFIFVIEIVKKIENEHVFITNMIWWN
jgi:hypothetical protein